MRILIVDDVEANGAIMKRLAMKDFGGEIAIAGSGVAGIRACHETFHDLIITDYMMPVMNGVEFALSIRSRVSENLPIILMSGAHAELARQNGHLFARIFDKPFVVGEVVDAVIALVGRPV